jgi:hypothetical protein
MAENLIPSNPNIPPPPSQVGNVVPLASPDTIANLKISSPPQAFGDQKKDIAKSIVIAAATSSVLALLNKEKDRLIQGSINLELTHQKNLAKLELQHTPKKQIQNGETVEIPAELTDEEYAEAVAIENANYAEAKKKIQEQKDKNKKAIDDFINDPFKEIKDEIKKRKNRTKKRKAKLTNDEKKAKKAKVKAILKNAKKTLVPILSLLLTNKIAEIIAQNGVIGKLVEDTNAIILEANESGDQAKLDNAKVVRDNAVRVIQSNEDKIIQINKDIKEISIYVSIFSTVISVISAIPIPTAPIPIATSLIIGLIKILERANKIVLALSALLPALLTSIDKAINILREYKLQLLDINGQLDSSVNDNLLSNPNQFGTTGEIYKGFNLAIKEENNPQNEVRGFKRHYATATNKQNVEVLKSEYSFTLDPNDLITQLKLIIDERNLQA